MRFHPHQVLLIAILTLWMKIEIPYQQGPKSLLENNKTIIKNSNLTAREKRELQKNMEKSNSIVFGHYIYELQQKLENKPGRPTFRDTQSVLDLLELIKVTTFKLQDEKCLTISINAKSVYCDFNQGNFSHNGYREMFMNVVEVTVSYGNQLHDEAVSRQVCEENHGHDDLKSLTSRQKKAVDSEAHNRYMSCGFRIKANHNKYGHLTTNFENNYMKGNNHYLKNKPNAYKYLSD